MNTNIESVVVSFLNMANNNLEKAVELAKENAPELVNQIMMWGVASNVLWIVFSFILVPLVVWGYVKLVKTDNCDDEFLLVLLGIGTLIFSLVGVVGYIVSIIEIVKIKVAPALYLFDYFKTMLPQ
jgi:hypothetical protein